MASQNSGDRSAEAGWVDFKTTKDNADVKQVLQALGLLDNLSEEGSELSGSCPLGPAHGKDGSFSVNVDKKNFNCLACKRRGSIIDLVKFSENISLREAATRIEAIMKEAKPLERSKKRTVASTKSERGTNTKKATRPSKSKLADAATGGTPFLSLDDANALVDQGSIKPHELLVVNVTTLDFLRGLVGK